MAIYFNNKILEPKVNGNSLEKRYATEMKEVADIFANFRRKGEKKSTLIFTRDFNKKWNKNKTTFKPCPPAAFPMVANVYLPDLGSVQIRYSKDPPTFDNNNRVTFTKGSMMFGDITAIEEDQMDLAWFLLRATNYIDKKMLKLEDKKQEFDNEFEKLKAQAKPYSLLFSEDRTEEELLAVAKVLFKDEEPIYEGGVSEIALSIWGKIKNGDKITEAERYKSLEKAILNEINKKGQSGQKVIIVNKEDGEKSESTPKLKAPIEIRKEKLLDEGLALGLAVDDGMTKDMLWTLIQNAKK